MNNNIRITLLLFVLSGSAGLAQQKVDYNTIILPINAKEIPFAEKLVQLAWANDPTNQLLYNEAKISEYNTKLAKRSFLNQINATGNINEFNINPPPTANGFPAFYPKYNFGATLNLGNFINDPVRVKKTKEETEIALKNIQSKKLLVRAEVLRRYQEYLAATELLKLQSESEADALNSFSLVEQKFKNGQANLVEFNSAQEIHNMRMTQKVMAKRDFEVSKINIEELIGVSLDNVH